MGEVAWMLWEIDSSVCPPSLVRRPGTPAETTSSAVQVILALHFSLWVSVHAHERKEINILFIPSMKVSLPTSMCSVQRVPFFDFHCRQMHKEATFVQWWQRLWRLFRWGWLWQWSPSTLPKPRGGRVWVGTNSWLWVCIPSFSRCQGVEAISNTLAVIQCKNDLYEGHSCRSLWLCIF